MKKVYVVILNWNGFNDTIECLETVFRSTGINYSVILCDNDSTDGSIQKIKTWADGTHKYENSNRNFSHLYEPELNKPISYIEYSKYQIDIGKISTKCHETKLIIISNGLNYGFAKGNNVGIKYALLCNDFDYIWLLNNDTVVTETALSALVDRMDMVEKSGLCGSAIRYYDRPDKIQVLAGARFNHIIGTSKYISDTSYTPKQVEENISYISAASMLISKRFLLDIGLLNENYFLYFEEIDLAMRNNEYRLLYAPNSIIYHKEGASIGSSKNLKIKSALSDYYSYKSRICFYKTYYSHRLVTIYIMALIYIIHRLWYRRTDNALSIIKACFGK